MASYTTLSLLGTLGVIVPIKGHTAPLTSGNFSPILGTSSHFVTWKGLETQQLHRIYR